MEIRQIAIEILRNLFEGYTTHGGTGIYQINEITDKYEVDANEMGKYLVRTGWVKFQRFDNDGFSCAISLDGIEHIAPTYFDDLIANASITAGLTGDWVGLMDTLSFEPRDFQRAWDVGKVMQDRGLAEVQNQAEDVFIKLTLEGKEQYQRKNQGGFID